MSDTPRTDAHTRQLIDILQHPHWIEFARKLERENAAMKADKQTTIDLRDWFAGQVLSSDWIADYSMIEGAELAYKYADALLAARAKEQP